MVDNDFKTGRINIREETRSHRALSTGNDRFISNAPGGFWRKEKDTKRNEVKKYKEGKRKEKRKRKDEGK